MAESARDQKIRMLRQANPGYQEAVYQYGADWWNANNGAVDGSSKQAMEGFLDKVNAVSEASKDTQTFTQSNVMLGLDYFNKKGITNPTRQDAQQVLPGLSVLGPSAVDQSKQMLDRYSTIITGLKANGMAPTADNVNAMNKQFSNPDGSLQPIDPNQLQRRTQLQKMGYDTTGMVGRQVDQTWDIKTAWEQANPGKQATQSNIQQYQSAASAGGNKDVSIGSTAAKIGATQTIETAAQGGNIGQPPTPGSGPTPPPAGQPGQPGNLGVTPGSASGVNIGGGTGPTGNGTPPAPGVAGQPPMAGNGYSTGLGETTGAVNKDYAKTASDNLETFFPGFKARQVELGKFADTLTADLNSGAIPEGLRKGFTESIRSAQGVRGLGASPLAAFDEAIGMSGAVQKYQSGQLGNLASTTDIMGKPLTAPGGYSDVKNLGENLVAANQGQQRLNQNQQQINLGAASDVLDRAEFTEGQDAMKNKPRPSFLENLGFGLLNAGVNAATGGTAKANINNNSAYY